MRLELFALEDTYYWLTHPEAYKREKEDLSDLDDEEEEAWQGRDTDKNMPVKINLCSPKVDLYPPLKKGHLKFTRDGEFYEGCWEITMGPGTDLRYAEEKVKRMYGSRWVPTSEPQPFLGYVYDNFGENPLIAIASSLTEDLDVNREIYVGGHGAMPLKLGTLEDFTNSAIMLTNFTSTFINSSLMATSLSRRLPKAMRNKSIHVRCNK